MPRLRESKYFFHSRRNIKNANFYQATCKIFWTLDVKFSNHSLLSLFSPFCLLILDLGRGIPELPKQDVVSYNFCVKFPMKQKRTYFIIFHWTNLVAYPVQTNISCLLECGFQKRPRMSENSAAVQRKR